MKKYIVKYYGINSEKAPYARRAIRILFISDLHNVSIGENNEKLLKRIDALNPDLVLLGGDLIVAKPGYSMGIALRFIKDLALKHRVYAANGNHEYRLRIYPKVYGTMYDRYKKQLEDSGVILLENEQSQIIVKNMPITIYGYELDRIYYERFKRHTLPEHEISKTLGKPNPETYNILLAHNPRYGDTYLEWGADLILGGHYHGGIIRLGKHTPLIGNEFTLFPKYGYGHYEKAGSHLITSAGIGEHTIPVRIKNPRELVVVDIQPRA